MALLQGHDRFEVVGASHGGAVACVWSLEVDVANAVAQRTVFDNSTLKLFAFSLLKGGKRSGGVLENTAKGLRVIVRFLSCVVAKIYDVVRQVHAMLRNEAGGLS